MKERKKKFERIALFINCFGFLLSGIIFIEESKWLFGTIQFIAALLNLIMFLRFKKNNIRLEISMLAFNVVVAFSIAYDYYLSGSQYIHYAWGAIAIMSIVALFVKIRKNKNQN